jgi:hypothetical protein
MKIIKLECKEMEFEKEGEKKEWMRGGERRGGIGKKER